MNPAPDFEMHARYMQLWQDVMAQSPDVDLTDLTDDDWRCMIAEAIGAAAAGGDR